MLTAVCLFCARAMGEPEIASAWCGVGWVRFARMGSFGARTPLGVGF